MQTVTTAYISVPFALRWSIPRIKSNLIRPHCLYRGRSVKHLLASLLDRPPSIARISPVSFDLLDYGSSGVLRRRLKLGRRGAEGGPRAVRAGMQRVHDRVAKRFVGMPP